ncbi:porin [Staphylococcus epidermidis]|nr:porin [Staphylococcus epidermidis]
MKRTLLALAALSASAAALAQSSVTVFGVADMSVAHISTSGKSVSGLANGGNSSSRLGFRGVEDSGGGLKAASGWKVASAWTTVQPLVSSSIAAPRSACRATSVKCVWAATRRPAYQNLETFHAFGDTGMGAINGHNLISSSAEGTSKAPIPTPQRHQHLLPGRRLCQLTHSFGEQAGDNSLASSTGLRLG